MVKSFLTNLFITLKTFLVKGIFVGFWFFSMGFAQSFTTIETSENITITAPYYERATYYWDTSDGKIYTARDVKYSHTFRTPGEHWIDLSIDYEDYTTPKTRYHYLVIDPNDKKIHDQVQKTDSEGIDVRIEDDYIPLYKGDGLFFEAFGFNDLRYEWYLDEVLYSSDRRALYSYKNENSVQNLELRLIDPSSQQIYDSKIWVLENINESPQVNSFTIDLKEGSDGLYQIKVDASDREESITKYVYEIYRNKNLYETLESESSEAEIYLKKFSDNSDFDFVVKVLDDIGQEGQAESRSSIFVSARYFPRVSIDFSQEDESLVDSDFLFFESKELLNFEAIGFNSYGNDSLELKYTWKVNGEEVSNENIFQTSIEEEGSYEVSLQLDEIHDFGSLTVEDSVSFEITKDPLLINAQPEVSLKGVYPGSVVPVGFPLEVYSEVFDSDSESIKIFWYFGDGNIEEGGSSTHIYEKPGNYDVSLVVTDGTHIVSRFQEVKVIPYFQRVTVDPASEMLVESMREGAPDLNRQTVGILEKGGLEFLFSLLEEREDEYLSRVEKLEIKILDTIRGPLIDESFWNSFEYIINQKIEKSNNIEDQINSLEEIDEDLIILKQKAGSNLHDWSSALSYFKWLENLSLAQEMYSRYNENDIEYYFYKSYLENNQSPEAYLSWLKRRKYDSEVFNFSHYIDSNSSEFWEKIKLDSFYDLVGTDLEKYKEEAEEIYYEREKIEQSLQIMIKSYENSLDFFYNSYDENALEYSFGETVRLEAVLPPAGERPFKILWKNDNGEILGRESVLSLSDLNKGSTVISFEVEDFEDNKHQEKIYINIKE